MDGRRGASEISPLHKKGGVEMAKVLAMLKGGGGTTCLGVVFNTGAESFGLKRGGGSQQVSTF